MQHKTLICITTCNRLKEVKKYILPYIQFCNQHSSFSFLLSLDGDNKEYLDFCNLYKIPLIYSGQREGVGLTKNRALKQFPDYDYYFFIDDDVELVNNKVFELFIKTALVTGYHHFSWSHVFCSIKVEQLEEVHLTHSSYGGGLFNFYSNEGLKKVGGWHTCFAKYKRFGHTEHTYRFFHAGLIPSPFIFIDEARSMFINHDPPHVTNTETVVENPVNELIQEEEELIKQKTTFFSLTTLSDFHFNEYAMDFNQRIDKLLATNRKKYPLINGRERRVALAEYYFFKFRHEREKLKAMNYFITSFFYYPVSNPLKHFIKSGINRKNK
jgi:hypothetical protein